MIATLPFTEKTLNRKAIGVLKCDKHRNYWLPLKASWICLTFALDLSYIDLLDKDLSDTELDF